MKLWPIVLGSIPLVLGHLYHILFHPEWTVVQALIVPWPYWLAGLLIMLVGEFGTRTK